MSRAYSTFGGRCGPDRTVVGFTHISVLITINVESSNPAHGEVYSMQHYVIKFGSNIRQVCSFLRVLLFSPPK
jgi:hypothetical protein